MRIPSPLTAAVLGTVVLATACSSADGNTEAEDAPGAGPHVVVTTTILGDVVTQLLDGAGQVDVLMAPGQDPHGFSPSAQQAGLLREADLVVANGLQLEESLLDVLEDAESDGVEVLRVAEHVDPLAFGETEEEHDAHADDADEHDEHTDEHDEHTDDDHADDAHTDDAHTDEHDEHADEEEHGHDHGPEDPHIWFDPVRMAEGARVIAAAVAEVDDAQDDQVWQARGEDVAAAIEAMHEEVVEILASVPDECRQLVTNHDALGYFAARYDFEVVATVLPGTSTEVDPSAREFADLAALLREAGVPAIFAENTSSTRLADALADEVGRDIEVVGLFTDALAEPGSGADTYLGLMTTDAQLVADALADC